MNGPQTKVKICGITRLADAELAVDLGAWAIGMIFYDGSPRRCSIEQAQLIASSLRRRVELCGVFVNAPLEEVVQVSEVLGLSMIQLHGDEGPAYSGEVPRRTGARVIKAAQVAGVGELRDLERYHVDFHLLDAHASGTEREGLRGGTGETFDWGLLAERRSAVPMILSGGLHPGNVAQAIALVDPFAVDSASGTESAPGLKDPEKLAAFFDAVNVNDGFRADEDTPDAAGSSAEQDDSEPALAVAKSENTDEQFQRIAVASTESAAT
jgi:phosphoribosylanthranilate isomerase